jgi:hypothetical protein
VVYQKFFFAAALAALSSGSYAGSVISTNLPADNYIVNIDGRNDGAAGFDGGQDRWYQPFAVNGSILQLTLPAGEYKLDVVNAVDAAARYPTLTSGQLGTIGSAWTYNSPFTTNYLVFDSSALSNPGQMQLFAGAGQAGPLLYSGEDAYQATKAQGVTDRLVSGPLGRNNGDVSTSFVLPHQQTLIFVVPDSGLWDNGGTLSVAVSPVPEPSTILALGGGLAILVRRRRRHFHLK